MRSEIIGLPAGCVFGLLNFGVLRVIAARMEVMKSTLEQERTAVILRTVAFADVISFAALGYFLLPMFME